MSSINSKNSTVHRRPLQPKGQRKRGRPRSKSAPAALSVAKCNKQKQWSNEAMEAAINSVIDENTPVLRAARKYGIPNQHSMTVFREKYSMVKSQDPANYYQLLKKKNFQAF